MEIGYMNPRDLNKEQLIIRTKMVMDIIDYIEKKDGRPTPTSKLVRKELNSLKDYLMRSCGSFEEFTHLYQEVEDYQVWLEGGGKYVKNNRW